MYYHEEKKDLFSVDFTEYTVSHCISADFKMGAGIAVPIRKKFHLGEMKSIFETPKPGVCCYYNDVLNLITKKRFYNKPSLHTMKSALESMRLYTDAYLIKKVAMPRIGSGLDRLKWPSVRELIHEVFEDADIEIMVCKK